MDADSPGCCASEAFACCYAGWVVPLHHGRTRWERIHFGAVDVQPRCVFSPALPSPPFCAPLIFSPIHPLTPSPLIRHTPHHHSLLVAHATPHAAVSLQFEPRRTLGRPPSPRGYHVSLLADSRIFVFGGFNGHDVYDDVHILELAAAAYLPQVTSFKIEAT